MKIKKEQVEEALASLEKSLAEGDINKASEDDLDQPEGGDLGNPAKEKMSAAAPGPDKSPKAKKSLSEDETEVSKGDDGDADDEGDDDDDDGGGEMFEKKKALKTKKSFAEELPEEVQTKIDVSEFLKSLVNHTGETIDALREYVAKSDVAHEARYGELAEVVEDIQKSQAKIGVVLKAICEKIGIIEAAPARAAKSDTVEKSVKATTERKFDSGLAEEQVEEKMFKGLSENPMIAKSQIASAMCELVKKGEATDLDVIGFESGGYVKPELVTKLKTVLN